MKTYFFNDCHPPVRTIKLSRALGIAPFLWRRQNINTVRLVLRKFSQGTLCVGDIHIIETILVFFALLARIRIIN